MSDALYLSLWYPNLRLAALPDKLVAVLGEFARHGGEALVYSTTVWPVNWSESPVFQQIYGRRAGAAGQAGGGPGAEPRAAVEEALELLHDDYAYEFQIGWSLWQLESGASVLSHPWCEEAEPRMGHPAVVAGEAGPSTSSGADFAQDDKASLDPRWVRGTRLVRVTAFGPLFDEGAYEQEGHIRIDFGDDVPFLEEEAELDSVAARHIEENVRQLVELTAAAEKASGATARLLWSELGESLAQRLAARLGKGN